jgi:hypothetical protein
LAMTVHDVGISRPPGPSRLCDYLRIPHGKDFRRKPLSRPEAVAPQGGRKRTAIVIIPRSCSDSPSTTSQINEAFGSDRFGVFQK